MLKHIYFTFLFVISVILLTLNPIDAQSADFSESIITKFNNQCLSYPQEKVYLQTDKPYYSAGEEIWFKGYLVNATTLVPNANSQFIYVELINRFDSVLTRVKIINDSLGFSGHIYLKPEMHSGNYLLRAYTYWMQNVGKDFFFKKMILIGNKIDDNITTQIKYGQPVDGLIPITLTVNNNSKKPIPDLRVDVSQNWSGSLKKRLSMLTNKIGRVNWQIAVDQKDTLNKIIEVSIKDKKYNNKFLLPKTRKAFDVQFFPESGAFLNNNLQSIALKAIGQDGLSVEVTGGVYNNRNEKITDFSTLNKGMGKFNIQTLPGESYYAIVKNTDGIEKRFDLPKTEANGVAIQLNLNKGGIFYNVLNQTNLPENSLYLLAHSRGKVYILHRLKFQSGKILESILPDGIVSFSIIDSLGHTYCERLSYIRSDSFPVIQMITDKPMYLKREAVNLDFKIHSKKSEPVNGNYSISITDSHTVKLDSLGDNIQSYLLMSSDIKGYIEDPASYFVDNSPASREKLDMLMMTQAWRRFKTADVVEGKFTKSGYYMEIGQALSGKVLNLFNKSAKDCNISMYSPYKSMIKIAKTDVNGRYIIDGIEFPDSTQFLIRAKKPRSLTDVEIVSDSDKFPGSDVLFPLVRTEKDNQNEKYFEQIRQKYFTEGGLRVVNLREVVVSAKKIESDDDADEYYSGIADAEIKSDQLEANPDWNILDFLNTIAGIHGTENGITIRGGNDNPMILVDDMEMEDFEEISYLKAADIQDIKVFKGANAAIFGAHGGNGVIAITLKKGVNLKSTPPVSMAYVMPLGYQKPAQFYVPKYNVDSVLNSSMDDLRATIYWNPALKTDSKGNVHVSFYTADHTADYSVVLEGITNNGEICRYVGYIKRK
ncbi:MAG: TonB-dependent receptor plug domain-containing protein [Bacteroidales bacterium]